MKLVHLVGNRPQFIKLAPFLMAAEKKNIQNIIIHSGQHYDYEMSKIFFDNLQIPEPNYHLEAGGGTHTSQTTKVMLGTEKALSDEKPALLVIYGDTNTTLAGALVAYKMNLPFAHVEAGLREYVWRPEEMNKKVSDHFAKYCFCPIQRACDNLKHEGVNKNNIFLTGDITYDTFKYAQAVLDQKAKIVIPKNPYFLLTMHRAETVDHKEKVEPIIEALLEINHEIIYPIHPRTEKSLKNLGLYERLISTGNIKIIPPVGYFDLLKLIKHSKLVITDSGGVIKEAFYSEKPGVAIDAASEYDEIYNLECSILTGQNKKKILAAVKKMGNKNITRIVHKNKIFGNGQSATKMVEIILSHET
ncbi:MAG: UDP-N-acetylglucosamine 2-epimerase (non-hydrolyzing) [Candidatus Margulisbacteria bacterium]|nr:UDP-N-acetylglucosamine 2-epimerase (non-hydrolyzing) [Candidatus Margulisiibacteriota bacterium]